MKALLSLVLLSLALVAIYPSQGQKVCEYNCFDTVPNCQIGDTYFQNNLHIFLIFKFIYLLRFQKKIKIFKVIS